MGFLGMLWLIINTFVFLLLLRAVYGPSEDQHSNRAMAWYFLTLSIVTDFLSMCIFGQHIVDETAYLAVFVLVCAVFMLLPKPLFAYVLLKSLQNDGFDVKKGLNLRKSTLPGADGHGGSSQYQGLDEQFGDTGYAAVPVPAQQQSVPDVVVQQPPPVTSGSENIGDSLMDNVGQHDVFAPGQ